MGEYLVERGYLGLNALAGLRGFLTILIGLMSLMLAGVS